MMQRVLKNILYKQGCKCVILLLSFLPVVSCSQEHSTTKTEKAINSFGVFKPNFQWKESFENLRKERIKVDIPYYKVEKGDSLLFLTLDYDEQRILSQKWVFPVNSDVEKFIEDLEVQGLRIVANYVDESYNVDTGETRKIYFPEAMDNFAVINKENWMFICSRYTDETGYFLSVEFKYPDLK